MHNNNSNKRMALSLYSRGSLPKLHECHKEDMPWDVILDTKSI